MVEIAEADARKIELVLERAGLDERQRRLFLAAEANALGHGGVAAVSRLTGAAESTIRAGLRELLGEAEEAPEGRCRRAGGGRTPSTERVPGLEGAVLEAVEGTTYGDPERAVGYTTKSCRNLADEVTGALPEGESVSHETVRSILKGNGYSPKGNKKCLQVGKAHPDRDAQITNIQERAEWYLSQGLPVISIDTKKKELVGEFKNGGREWSAKGEYVEVKDHDFMGEGGKAVPYGVYDVGLNRGYVSVGCSRDTAEFAVATLQWWWDAFGREIYGDDPRIMVTCDGGGSNAWRSRLWRLQLQLFCDRNKVQVEVHHYTPGNSKFNKIERRLFSEITKHWRGQPLTSLEVVRDLVASTTTRTGLVVEARIDRRSYACGIKVPDAEVAALDFVRDDFHGEWNYLVRPRATLDLGLEDAA